MNATKTLIATYPRRRPALSAAHQAIYEAEYKLNRNGDRFVEDLSKKLEGWMHRRVARAQGSPILEVGAGTLNHLRWERDVGAYDVVEPFTSLYADSPALALVRESYRTGQPLEWNRVHDLADFAYFNHSIHVAKGVGCSTCHGEIDNMPAVYQESTLQMEWCIACHREPGNFIRPKSEIYNMQWQDGDITADERLKLKEDYKIRSKEMLTSCSVCHR